MPFVDPNSTHNPTTNQPAPASWGDVVRDDLLALRGNPRVRVGRSTTQAIASGALTAVQFDLEHHDTHSLHSTSSNTSRITIPTNWGGTYLVGACVQWALNTDPTNRRHAEIRRDGVTKIVDIEGPPDSAGYCTQQLTTTWHALESQYIELLVYQETGSPVNVQNDAEAGTHFWAHFIGDGVG